jgi:hypothetical protein
MNLDEAQRQKVATWVAEGLKLSDIQTRVGSEFGLRLTYMEVRLLVDDLKLTPKDTEPAKPPPTLGGAPSAGAAPGPGREPPSAAGVSVSVDQVTRPGALVSGKVKFSDGKSADWYMDQTGRLGVVPKEQGYKPTSADVQEFQLALQDELAKLGY